jgi:hypothetical protein
MTQQIEQFPIQKLAARNKTKEWREQCVDYVIGARYLNSNSDLPDDSEIQSNYDLYNGIYNPEDLKYVTNPFDQDDGFPARMQDMNVIRPKIDLLLGEETKRPFNLQVIRTSRQASSELANKAKQMVLDFMMASVMAKMSPEGAARYQQALSTGEIAPPEQIAKYLTRDYKDMAEVTAYHSLKYLDKKLNLSHEFLKGWKDALIAGREVYYTGIENGNPVAYQVNPKNFWFNYNEGLDFIHESDMCCYEMRMSASQIYDRFYDKMDESELNQLLEIAGQGKSPNGSRQQATMQDYGHYTNRYYNRLPNHNPFGTTDLNNIQVFHVCWRSYKKIGFVSIFDETGELVEYQVDESYKPTGFEQNIEWDWIIEIWEGYKISDDMYLGIAPIAYQYIANDNLNSQRLPYTGVIYSNTNSKSRSLLSVMKPLQYMYMIIWYRLELAIARDRGKVLLMDITQIPKSQGLDPDKWMHYLTSLGVVFVNPYEEGFDVPGREGGKSAAFNQFQSMDLTMGNAIAQYVNILAKLEEMLDTISGVSRQRQGAINTQELVGTTDRSIIQSANITEPLFWLHNQVKKEVFTMLLNIAKATWGKNPDKTYLQYVMDDATRAFMRFADNWAYEDFDIFITDATKENTQLEQVRQLIQPAMQNGGSIIDAIEILTTDNISMLKAKLEEMENDRIQQAQAAQEREYEAQQQIQQMDNEVKQQEIAIQQAQLDLQQYKIDADNQTRVLVAEIGAFRGQEDQDITGNGIADQVEYGRLGIEQLKANSDAQTKQLEAQRKSRETELKAGIERERMNREKQINDAKNSIEKERIRLEKQKLTAQKQLQKQKDDAAYKREQLKARTALRNKVVGQR